MQEYDIAILTLNENVTTVKPVKLVSGSQTEEIEDYKRALITGWGRTKCKYYGHRFTRKKNNLITCCRSLFTILLHIIQGILLVVLIFYWAQF